MMIFSSVVIFQNNLYPISLCYISAGREQYHHPVPSNSACAPCTFCFYIILNCINQLKCKHPATCSYWIVLTFYVTKQKKHFANTTKTHIQLCSPAQRSAAINQMRTSETCECFLAQFTRQKFNKNHSATKRGLL